MIAWHYTTHLHYDSIKAHGYIFGATALIEVNERPVVWFSMHPWFEPTAAKGIMGPDGRQRTATIDEMIDIGGGLVRLGVSRRGLLAGEELRKRARIRRETWASLCRSAKSAGGDPAQWVGSLQPVLLTDCIVERMDAGHHWRRVKNRLSDHATKSASVQMPIGTH